MKKKILALALALLLLMTSMSLSVFAAETDTVAGKNAISSLENWQEKMFMNMGRASVIGVGNPSDKYFKEGTAAPAGTVFWFLFMTPELKEYVNAEGYFNSTYEQYMSIAEAYFVNAPDMSQYLIDSGRMDEGTQQVHFFMGGVGSDWKWVMTESEYDGYNDVWRIRGIFCNGWLSDTTGLTEYVDYYDNFKIDSAVELTLKEDDIHGFRVASYSELDYYINKEEHIIYKYNEEADNFSNIYYPINVTWYDGQTIYLEEGTYTEIGNYRCCQSGQEVKWYSECADRYIGRVELTRTEQGNTVTSVVGASGSVIGGPNIELRAVPFCQFEMESPNAEVEVVQGLEDLGDGTYGSVAPTSVELKITANKGYKVTGVEAKEQSKYGNFAVGTYNSDTDTWKFYVEFMPDTIVVSTEKVTDSTVTIVSGAGSEEKVTVQMPAEDAEKVEGLTLVAKELEPGAKEDETKLIVEQLDVAKENVYILDIYFENIEGEEVKVNANMVVTVPIPEGWNPANTAVYYVNTEAGEMVDMKAVVSKDGKTISFTTNHFSHYALVQKEVSVTPDSPIADNPQTGDTSNMILWVGLLLVAVIGLAGVAIYGYMRKKQF